MLKQIKYIFILLFITGTTVVTAQQDSTLSREVEVTKAFKPTISDANKINVMPKADKTEHQSPEFDYSINSQPILNTFSVKPLKAATINSSQKKGTGYGLIRAGVGNYNKPYGEFFFNHLNSKKSIFGIHAKHLSSHGKVELVGGDKVDAPYARNEADVYYKHDFRKSVLSVNADIKHDGFNYYGYPEDPIPEVLLENDHDHIYQGKKQAFTKGGFSINLKDPTAEMDDPVINFNAKYHYFGTKTGQREHLGEFQVDFQKPLNTGTILADIGVTYVDADEKNEPSNYFVKSQETWMFFKPAYYLEGKMVNLSAGFNFWYVMNADETVDAVAKISPNVKVNFMPVEDVINIYAGVDGNYINNHYSKIAYENPFVNPMHNVNNSFEKLHFFGGFKGKFSSKTNFKIGVDYSMIDDKPLYYLSEHYYPAPSVGPSPLVVYNTFGVLYDNIDLLKFNVEVFHTSSEKIDLLLSGNYYSYNLEEQVEAWNLPSWDANISIDYKITEQLSVGTDIYLIGDRKALIRDLSKILSLSSYWSDLSVVEKSYNLDTTFDLNVNATYQITQQFSVFGQLNNFGFQKYQRWFGYPVQSFNALVGVSYAF